MVRKMPSLVPSSRKVRHTVNIGLGSGAPHPRVLPRTSPQSAGIGPLGLGGFSAPHVNVRPIRGMSAAVSGPWLRIARRSSPPTIGFPLLNRILDSSSHRIGIGILQVYTRPEPSTKQTHLLAPAHMGLVLLTLQRAPLLTRAGPAS